MRIALVDVRTKSTMYPLALLKAATWRKELGDECELFNDRLPKAGEFDEIWVSTCFTFDIPHAVVMIKEAKKRAPHVKVGGIAATLMPHYFERLGVDLHLGLHDEIEKQNPDYSILGYKPAYSITHTSRGCLRRCNFCMVSKLEPKFHNRDNWPEDIHPDTDTVLFYDNNWFAKKKPAFKRDIKMIRELIARGKIKRIDFNQGLDARLLTKEIADLLIGLPIYPIRFAFDDMRSDGYYQRAVEMMVDRGFTYFVSYVLYNYKDTPEDLYYRLRESTYLTIKYGHRVCSFPMCYCPILEIRQSRDFVGENWTKKQKKGFQIIKNALSAQTGTFTCDYLKDFEFWMGKDEKEFIKLLNYPKIRQLCQRKKGKIRMDRATGNWNPEKIRDND